MLVKRIKPRRLESSDEQVLLRLVQGGLVAAAEKADRMADLLAKLEGDLRASAERAKEQRRRSAGEHLYATLPPKVREALVADGIDNAEKLLATSARDLLKVPNVKNRHVLGILEECAKVGLSLK